MLSELKQVWVPQYVMYTALASAVVTDALIA